jgi:hypothetical protein
MVRSLIVGIFGYIEYAVVFLFIAAIAFALVQGLDVIAPEEYNTSAEDELTQTIKDGFESKQITPQQAGEIWRIYQDDRARLQRWRIYILYAVSICISAAVVVLLFKKYRSLRFRERLRDYFFPAMF